MVYPDPYFQCSRRSKQEIVSPKKWQTGVGAGNRVYHSKLCPKYWFHTKNKYITLFLIGWVESDNLKFHISFWLKLDNTTFSSFSSFFTFFSAQLWLPHYRLNVLSGFGYFVVVCRIHCLSKQRPKF